MTHPEFRLCIGIPTAGTWAADFGWSLAVMMARVAAVGIPTLPERPAEVNISVHNSSVIHANRERLVEEAIDRKNTHLLFLDDDMSFDPRVLDILAGRRLPVVGVNYRVKSDAETKFVAVGLDGKRIETNEKSIGLHPVSYTGFGVSLFDLKVFKKTRQPWFLPIYTRGKGKGYSTEDFPCYQKIRKAGFPVYVDHEASKLVGHVGRRTYRWSDRIVSATESGVEPQKGA